MQSRRTPLVMISCRGIQWLLRLLWANGAAVGSGWLFRGVWQMVAAEYCDAVVGKN